jgi:hypothetical protein
MNLDWADVGNFVLGVGMSAGAYLATKGLVAESVLVIAIAGAVKALCSAIDNYKFKKTVP